MKKTFKLKFCFSEKFKLSYTNLVSNKTKSHLNLPKKLTYVNLSVFIAIIFYI